LPALTLDAGGIDGDPSAERGDPNDEKTDGEANEELLTPRFAPHDDSECELSGAWGEKFLICFTICFFVIWISTLGTWVTIYSARIEGQGRQSAPFSNVACATLNDATGTPATSTASKGSAWQDGIVQTSDSKWRPTLYGKVQSASSSIEKVELQSACPSWNRDGALFVDNKLVSYSNSRGMTEDTKGIKGYPADNLADFTIADCNNRPQIVAKFFSSGATAKYNLPTGVTAALVIKNASTCLESPCDFESTSYPTIAYASPVTGFTDPSTKFWQSGKQGTIVINDMSSTAIANLQIALTSPPTIGATLLGNYAATGLALHHLILIGGKGVWTDGGKYYFTNPRDMEAASYRGGCMNTYMGTFVTSFVFLAFFVTIILVSIIICIARRCCGAGSRPGPASAPSAATVELAAPVPIRMN